MPPILPTTTSDFAEDPSRPPRAAPAGRTASTAGVVLGLQRSHGNRSVARSIERRLARQATSAATRQAPAHVPWAQQTTGENRALAKEIDELEALDMEEYRHRRAITEMRAADPSDAHYEEYKRSLDAFEFVEAERIAPMRVKRELLDETYDGGSHRIRRRNVRVVIEQGVQQTGSLRQSIEEMKKPKAIENDIYFIERDADRFGERFVVQARRFADVMLVDSREEILEELQHYGLRPSSALYAADRIRAGQDRAKVVRDTVEAPAVWAPDEDAAGNWSSARKWRQSLGDRVKSLKAQQAVVHARRDQLAHTFRHSKGEIWIPDHAAYDAAKERVAQAERHLASMWSHDEHVHKGLAGFRGGETNLADVDLGALDDGSSEDHPQMTALLTNLLQKIADIDTLRDRIVVQRNLSPCSLPPVVAVTKAAMFVPAGSIRDGKVNDLVEDAQDKSVAKYIGEGLLALIVLATVLPSGGATLPVAIGLASAALSATSAVEDWEHYKTQRLLANSALDRANALVAEDPSLLPFAFDLISLGIDGLPLIKAFHTIVELRNLVRARQEIQSEEVKRLLQELDAIGAAKKDPKLGEQVLKDLQNAERDASTSARPKGTSEPQPAPKESKPPGKPKRSWFRRAVHPPPGSDYLTADEVRRAVGAHIRNDLRYAADNEEWTDLWKVINDNGGRAAIAKDNPLLMKLLVRVHKLIRDPQVLEDAMVELWTMAGRQGITEQEALIRWFGGEAGMPRVYGQNSENFRIAMLDDKPMIDELFRGETHGAYTHMFQEFALSRVLGGKNAVRRFRQAIALAKGPDSGSTRFFSLVWDALFDAYDGGEINSPDGIGPILRAHLNFEGGVPHP